MSACGQQYYRDLSQGYEAKIRQLVPAYDGMTGWVLELLVGAAPAMVLDIGCGNGRFSARVLDRIPGARLVGVEASPAMAEEARAVAAACGDRFRVVHADVLDFQPDHVFDAAFSNLVLHNIPGPRKQALLGRLAGWLRPGGVFVWGDLVRHADAATEALLVAYRERFARERGCPEELLRQNFRKESTDDHPLTVAATIDVLAEAGFEEAAPVWAHDTFAVVVARTPA